MNTDTPINRRRFLTHSTLATSAGAMLANTEQGSNDEVVEVNTAASTDPQLPPLLTADADFYDVSRGNPKPHTLTGQALVDAGMTPESWRCEITADPMIEEPHTKVAATLEKPLTIADGTALDLPTLMELGKKHAVHFLKAMQCLNIDTPLGQGLWTGVPLREVLKLCGKATNVRRIYYWGFHNNDPKQVFKSSVSYTQCMETAPGELPVFLAYRLNGQPLSPLRGGPVRMIVPWSHGYKSIKWLNHIFVTNDPRNYDTYAEGNNDPDSFLKTAAYLDKSLEGRKVQSGQAVHVHGQVISGLSGVARVEFWLRPIDEQSKPLADSAPELLDAVWQPCELQAIPDWSSLLPDGMRPQQLLGFDKATGQPNSWPTRYGMCAFTVTLRDLKPGKYELRARSVDLNGFAQPEPRPSQKSGKNNIQVRRIEVV